MAFDHRKKTTVYSKKKENDAVSMFAHTFHNFNKNRWEDRNIKLGKKTSLFFREITLTLKNKQHQQLGVVATP